jgi:hypothetical protein
MSLKPKLLLIAGQDVVIRRMNPKADKVDDIPL